MTRTTYLHRATRQLEGLEPFGGPSLHDRIYNDILIAGKDFHQEQAGAHKAGTDLLGALMEIHQSYTNEAGPFGDMFGEYLECNGQTSERNGQFFTPVDLVDIMVALSFSGKDLSSPQTICDPAAGTGRFMLRTAKHFGKETGMFNFIITNIDLDFKAFVYCTTNAILSGIPAFHIWGNSLSVEIYDAFATIPMNNGFALWERLPKGAARRLVVASQAKKCGEEMTPTHSTREAIHAGEMA